MLAPGPGLSLSGRGWLRERHLDLTARPLPRPRNSAVLQWPGDRVFRDERRKEETMLRNLWSRQALGVAALVTVAAVFATAASAAKPVKGPCESCTASASFPAGFICPFAFSFEDVVDNRFQITYPNGLIKIAGDRVIRVTNEDTHESRIFQLNGIVTIDAEGARVVTTSEGPFLWGFVPGDLGEGQPGVLLYIRGQAREVDEFPGPHPNAFGFTTLSFEVTGSSENLCETMA
jgi:hypothetical protein